MKRSQWIVLGIIGVVGFVMLTRKVVASDMPSDEEPTGNTTDLLTTDINPMNWLNNLTQDSKANELKWRPLIQQTEIDFGLPTGLLSALLFRESRYRTDIITGALKSKVGAAGIAQFMPATAAEFGINPLDPTQAIPAAARHLVRDYTAFGDWKLAVAAYNAGPGNVKKYNGIPPFEETQTYVAEIFSNLPTSA